MPKENAIANEKNKVNIAAHNAAYFVLYPTSNNKPNNVSIIVLVMPIVGITDAGINEFTCAVYCKKLLQPDEYLPHIPSLLATAEKKPQASASRSNKAAVD